MPGCCTKLVMRRTVLHRASLRIQRTTAPHLLSVSRKPMMHSPPQLRSPHTCSMERGMALLAQPRARQGIAIVTRFPVYPRHVHRILPMAGRMEMGYREAVVAEVRRPTASVHQSVPQDLELDHARRCRRYENDTCGTQNSSYRPSPRFRDTEAMSRRPGAAHTSAGAPALSEVVAEYRGPSLSSDGTLPNHFRPDIPTSHLPADSMPSQPPIPEP